MQIMAALPMLAAAASFVAPPSVSMRSRMGPVRMASTSGLVTGEMVPAGALEALGVTAGKRAVIAFYCRDDGFECKKELLDLNERALTSMRGCEIVAVRTDSMNSVKEGTEALYPALRFVVDEGDEIRRSLRMGTSGLRGGDRHTYLVDEEGRVQGQMNNFADPFCHAAMATRTLKAMDKDGYNAASADADAEAASRQKIWDANEAERVANQEQVKQNLAEKKLAAEQGKMPWQASEGKDPWQSAEPSKFFQGFFGAFDKKKGQDE